MSYFSHDRRTCSTCRRKDRYWRGEGVSDDTPHETVKVFVTKTETIRSQAIMEVSIHDVLNTNVDGQLDALSLSQVVEDKNPEWNITTIVPDASYEFAIVRDMAHVEQLVSTSLAPEEE